MNLPALREEAPSLIVNRRAIAAGLAALVATPMTGSALARELKQLSNVKLTFDPDAFSGMMSGDLFLPDYRFPMARIVFEDGSTTRWHRWTCMNRGPGQVGPACRPNPTKAVAIETCAPDKNGAPRYAQLQIG